MTQCRDRSNTLVVESAATTASAPPNTRISHDFFFWVDEPQSWELTAPSVRVSGWCVAKSGRPLVAVRARIGDYKVERRLDQHRPDVATYIGVPDAPRWCGFTLEINVPPGIHSLQFQGSADGRKWRHVFSADVRGASAASIPPGATDEPDSDRFAIWFDRPQDWSRPASRLYVGGWCIDRSGAEIRAIRARIGGRTFAGNYGIPRPDLPALFPNTPGAGDAGFAIEVPLRSGDRQLDIEVQGADRIWRLAASETVIGDPAAAAEELAPAEQAYYAREWKRPSRLAFWVHPPGGDWSKRSRYVNLAGWCFARRGPEVAEVRARVRGKTFAGYYGIPRPDVAVAYERLAGSLRNGFSIDVIVPWGPCTLRIEARSRGGEWETFFAQRVRGPLAWRSEDVQSDIGNYPAWIREYDSLTREDRKLIRADVARLRNGPLFSILMPVHNPDLRLLERAIDSVRAQFYEHWELCIVDDASTDPRVWKFLERRARRDGRIKLLRQSQNLHISATSNNALTIAGGEFVALMDQDDELAPTALYFAARELDREPSLELLYTDEDKLDGHGRRCDPHFKPDWNPDLFASQNYISHLAIYRASLVREIGGFRVGLEGAQDYDITWRFLERIDEEKIRHIPRVLYHWRSAGSSAARAGEAKPYALSAAARAVQEHFDRSGIAARVEPHRQLYLRARYPFPADPPLVSIIIATRDRADVLRRCVESILRKTTYPHFEIILLDNESREADALEYLATVVRDKRVQVRRCEGEFNFSKLNNAGVQLARGDIVALLNNDLEVINDGWLSEMVSHAVRPEIGAVGARLWYPNGTIQHAGVILGAGGIGNHAHAGIRDEPGYFSRPHLTQDLSAVTGACIVLRKEVYRDAGGLDEKNLAVAFNDIDLCLRIGRSGLRIVWTPHAELFHHESMSRGFEDTPEKRSRFLAEADYMHDKWRAEIENDPAYNPNLSLGPQLFTLAWPPRLSKPWREQQSR